MSQQYGSPVAKSFCDESTASDFSSGIPAEVYAAQFTKWDKEHNPIQKFTENILKHGEKKIKPNVPLNGG